MDFNFAAVDRWLEDAYPQMERDLLPLLALPSLKEAAEPGAPFGRPLAEALDYCLELARGFGLEAVNVDGYLGFADLLGQEKEQVGILSHVDVVPANPADWQSGPFDPEIRDGRIYARGTSDDKGPLVASLYAGLALARTGAPLKKTLRFMFGCDEEAGMSCVDHYLQHHQPPFCSFSPDGSFPVVQGEKGLGKFALTAKWPADEGAEPLKLVSVASGSVINVVPDTAQAVFSVTGPISVEGAEISGLKIEQAGKILRMSATGTATHASTPEEGENALVKLLQFLSRQQFSPRGAKRYIDTLAKLFQDQCYGESLGIAEEDALSKLTLAPTILHIDEKEGSVKCDMRFILTRKADHFYQKLQGIAQHNRLTLEDWQGTEPLYADEHSELLAGLLQAYRAFSGDNETAPIIMGGGTYAKKLPNCLAFGPAFPGTSHVAHQADEYIDRQEWLDSAKIYARAIYNLAK